ncbi:hypothetical protein B0H14DRAFT_3600703 [Mycena olivaceomarginata]|nr:hypothetical protein B0H14DRAFT_3600703 [Mycena olivaceomarginata]
MTVLPASLKHQTLVFISRHPASTDPPTSPQCCAAIVPSTSEAAIAVGPLLGVDLSPLNPAVPVGLACSPITVIGNNCGATVVCDPPPVEWSSLMAINCLPLKRETQYSGGF